MGFQHFWRFQKKSLFFFFWGGGGGGVEGVMKKKSLEVITKLDYFCGSFRLLCILGSFLKVNIQKWIFFFGGGGGIFFF